MTQELYPIGTLVMTPLGRPARVVKHVFGKRGDIPRCIVRYVDTSRKAELRIVPALLHRIDLEGADDDDRR